MAELTVQEITTGGVEPTYDAAAGGGDHFIPDSQLPHLLHVKNGGGGSITATIDDPTSSATAPPGAAAFNPDVALVVPAGEERIAKLIPRRFVDTATGQVNITYSGVTSVTVAVLLVSTDPLT